MVGPVRDHLANDAAASNSDDGVDTFLMDDILDVSEFFTTKFKLLVSYADHIVGVYEHFLGGHAWEGGYIDQPTYRDRTRAFYRAYETEEGQYSAYDGMFCTLSPLDGAGGPCVHVDDARGTS
ncbi:hypothetical protein [Halobaculum roseum]|uniref:Uncharacterized protein n=1 Tax=Halobaculum roseum TaxID=2175149 RepID=A0ABD5MU68_9EURY|nr:hypothetical protein [Halobaculum roseum]